MFSFAQVFEAICEVHSVEDDRTSALDGRLKNFQRLGFAPTNPGKGKRVSYSAEDALLWCVALEMGKFSLPPTIIIPFLRENVAPMLAPALDWTGLKLPESMAFEVNDLGGQLEFIPDFPENVGRSFCVIHLRDLWEELRDALGIIPMPSIYAGLDIISREMA